MSMRISYRPSPFWPNSGDLRFPVSSVSPLTSFYTQDPQDPNQVIAQTHTELKSDDPARIRQALEKLKALIKNPDARALSKNFPYGLIGPLLIHSDAETRKLAFDLILVGVNYVPHRIGPFIEPAVKAALEKPKTLEFFEMLNLVWSTRDCLNRFSKETYLKLIEAIFDPAYLEIALKVKKTDGSSFHGLESSEELFPLIAHENLFFGRPPTECLPTFIQDIQNPNDIPKDERSNRKYLATMSLLGTLFYYVANFEKFEGVTSQILTGEKPPKNSTPPDLKAVLPLRDTLRQSVLEMLQESIPEARLAEALFMGKSLGPLKTLQDFSLIQEKVVLPRVKQIAVATKNMLTKATTVNDFDKVLILGDSEVPDPVRLQVWTCVYAIEWLSLTMAAKQDFSAIKEWLQSEDPLLRMAGLYAIHCAVSIFSLLPNREFGINLSEFKEKGVKPLVEPLLQDDYRFVRAYAGSIL